MINKQTRQRMAMAVIAGAALSTLAADYYWMTDAGSGNWNDTSKWNPSTGVPGSSDSGLFTELQTAPFTVTLTNDVSAKLAFGSSDATKPVVATFELNGYTLTTLSTPFDAHRALDWTVLNGTLRTDPTAAAINIGYVQGDWVPKVTLGAGAVYLQNSPNTINVGSRSAGELVIRDGGRFVTENSSLATALRLGYTTTAGYTNYTARLTVTGAGSVWSNRSGHVYLASHALATAEMNITDNASLVNNGGTIYIAQTNSAATVNITAGGSLTHNGVHLLLGGGQGAVGTLNISSGGSLTHQGATFAIGNLAGSAAAVNITDGGTLTHKGSTLTVGNAKGVNASVNIASCGVLDVRGTTNFMSIGYGGTGTVTVTGTDSKLLVATNFYLANTANSLGTLIVEQGGLFERTNAFNSAMYLGYKDSATGRVIVRDGGQLRWVGGQGSFWLGSQGTAEGSTGELIVTGAFARAIMGEVPVASTRGNGLVTVAGGGTLELFRHIYLGRIETNKVSSHNGVAKLVVTGAGSVLKRSSVTTTDFPGASIADNTSLGVGGCGFQGWTTAGLLYYKGYGPGGKGEVVAENGGLVRLNAYLSVYPDSTLRIDGGRTESAYIGLETNAVFNAVLRAGDANGSALMTATSEVRVWGATLNLQLGADFARHGGDVYTLISGPLHATLNRFTYNGSRLQDGDVIEAGGTEFKVAYTANAVTLTVRQTGTLIKVL